ncbi:MAG TPA: divalent metal cation transporter, partial [Candidatus Eisenbacteria bacterium]|nr:divalent metal cation transporter [Candidatus Eisenbacteria bacterium]
MGMQDDHTHSTIPSALPSVRTSGHLSLENVHGSVEVPHHQASFWEQWRAFVGPAILVSVGYM